MVDDMARNIRANVAIMVATEKKGVNCFSRGVFRFGTEHDENKGVERYVNAEKRVFTSEVLAACFAF